MSADTVLARPRLYVTHHHVHPEQVIPGHMSPHSPTYRSNIGLLAQAVRDAEVSHVGALGNGGQLCDKRLEARVMQGHDVADTAAVV
jgi:hypothetical protein